MPKQIIQAAQIADLQLPEGYSVVYTPSAEEVAQTEIDRLQAELDGMTEPSDEELIELGKISHPYYQKQRMLIDAQSKI
jgi:hypothetical protein